MMNTSENPYGQLSIGDKILNFLLFGKSFEWKVLWPLEKCVERLSEMSSPKGAIYDGMSQRVQIHQVYEQGYEVRFAMIPHRVDGKEAITGGAYATGVIYADQALEKTIFKGYVQATVGLSIGLFIIALFVFLLFFVIELAVSALHILDLCGCFALLVPAFLVLHLIELQKGKFSRNQLYDLLEATFPIENVSKKKKHEEQKG